MIIKIKIIINNNNNNNNNNKMCTKWYFRK